MGKGTSFGLGRYEVIKSIDIFPMFYSEDIDYMF